MNIVFSSDNHYIPYLAVALYSVLRHHHGQAIDFYVLDLGIEEQNKRIIGNLVAKYQCQIEFIAVQEQDFEQFPHTIDYISRATYARLKLADYLPKCDKVLYLDVDILVQQDLHSLWAIDLGEAWIGACVDAWVEFAEEYKHKIGLSEKEHYFNAGVLLIDLKKWRTINVLEASSAWLAQYPHIYYQDQDILNGVFKGKVKYINTRFNFMPHQKSRIKLSQKQNWALNEIEKMDYPIVIVHYCGQYKAWHAECGHTQSRKYFSYFKQLQKIISLPDDWQNRFVQSPWWRRAQLWKREVWDAYRYKIR